MAGLSRGLEVGYPWSRHDGRTRALWQVVMRHHLSALSRRQARQRAEMARLRAETLAERERVRRERLELEQQARETGREGGSRDTVEM